MNIVDEVYRNRKELEALKGVQQTSLSNLQSKYSYTASKTFTFETGRYPQTTSTMTTFPKRIKLTFTPTGNQKSIATATCVVTAWDGIGDPFNMLRINQNVDTSKNTSWDLCFMDSFKSGSETIGATVSFRVTCYALSSGSITLTEY